MKLKISL